MMTSDLDSLWPEENIFTEVSFEFCNYVAKVEQNNHCGSSSAIS